jgi:glucokinase
VATAGRYLGLGLATVIAAFAPDVLVLGGGAMLSHDLLLGPARQMLLRHQLYKPEQTVLRLAELGDFAGAIGAASDAMRLLGTTIWAAGSRSH